MFCIASFCSLTPLRHTHRPKRDANRAALAQIETRCDVGVYVSFSFCCILQQWKIWSGKIEHWSIDVLLAGSVSILLAASSAPQCLTTFGSIAWMTKRQTKGFMLMLPASCTSLRTEHCRQPRTLFGNLIVRKRSPVFGMHACERCRTMEQTRTHACTNESIDDSEMEHRCENWWKENAPKRFIWSSPKLKPLFRLNRWLMQCVCGAAFVLWAVLEKVRATRPK